jgi:hypothetical protein
MPWLFAFAGGFLATLVCHQGVMAVFHLAGLAPAPFNMTPVPPLGVPAVLSLAFWGGVWGVPVHALARGFRGRGYWFACVLAGAIGPTAVAMLWVFPLKGLAVSITTVVGGLIVNAAWGLGLAAFMRAALRLYGAQAR